MIPFQAQIIVLIASVGIAAAGGYRVGYKLAEGEHLKEKAATLTKTVEQVKEAQDSDQQVIEKRQESAQVVTRTITKVQREIVKLPVRDCGFTHDERMSINAVYCASFPDAASCLPDKMPSGPRATDSERGNTAENVGS